MFNTIKAYWKKEYLLILTALLCLLTYYYRESLDHNAFTEYLPIIGGLAFGLNTLITLAKPTAPAPQPDYVRQTRPKYQH